MNKSYIIINWNNNDECHSNNNNNDSKHKLSQPWRKKKNNSAVRNRNIWWTLLWLKNFLPITVWSTLTFFFSLIADYSKLIWSFGHKFRHRFNSGIHSTIRSVANEKMIENEYKKEREKTGRPMRLK